MTADSPLKPAILRTLAFFDQADFPLTLQEIQSYLTPALDFPLPPTPPSLSELKELLHNTPGIFNSQGLYALRPDLQPLISERLKRYDIAETKWQLLMPKIKTIAALPYVRAIFVVNTLAWSNARADSDIDLCILTEPGHIWTARQWVTGWAAIKGDRPTSKHEADTLCLSLYMTTDQLNLQSVIINQQDIHLAMWLAQFHPVYDPHQLHTRLWQANSWARQLLPYATPTLPDHRRQYGQGAWGRGLRRTLEALQPRKIEPMYKKIQLRIMPQHLKTMANQGPGVVISDSMLKFHDKDPRQRLHQEWTSHISQLSSQH